MFLALLGLAAAEGPDWMPAEGIQRVHLEYWSSLPYGLYFSGPSDVPGLFVIATNIGVVARCRSPRDDVLRCDVEQARVRLLGGSHAGETVDYTGLAEAVADHLEAQVVHIDFDSGGNVERVGLDSGDGTNATWGELLRRGFEGLDGIADAKAGSTQEDSLLAACPGVPGVVSRSWVEHAGTPTMVVGNGTGAVDGGVGGIYEVEVRTETVFEDGKLVGRQWTVVGFPASFAQAWEAGRGPFLAFGSLSLIGAHDVVDVGGSAVIDEPPTAVIARAHSLQRRHVDPGLWVPARPRTFIPFLDIGAGAAMQSSGLRGHVGVGGFLTSRAHVGLSATVANPHAYFGAPLTPYPELRLHYGVNSPGLLHPGGSLIGGPAWNDIGVYGRVGVELSTWIDVGALQLGARGSATAGLGRRVVSVEEIFEADLLVSVRVKQPRRPL